MAIRFLKEPVYKKQAIFYEELLKYEYCAHDSISIIEVNGNVVLQCDNVECMMQWKDYLNDRDTSGDTTNG